MTWLSTHEEYEYGHIVRLAYLLEDSNFVTRVEFSVPMAAYLERGEASIIPAALTTFYLKYGVTDKQISKNLAIFHYKTLKYCAHSRYRQLSYIRGDSIWVDKYFPNLEYGKKYLPCVINQWKMANYVGK